ncbi:MAG: AI-2E family transporter [Rhodoferax sp.]|uniref:AI-2E family transporter n=1 Tax=Rhodoferax sp. TaxID=50421 RepID=UPI0027287061|nr:AI-2E family transporter [Rhodoferax sp.]MDO8447655.1 AI-2E family transporter [Rhodoferax sp.]
MRELTGSSLTRLVLLGLFLALLGVGVAVVLAPFVVAMLWAGILAFASWPLYVRLLRSLGGRAWPAALCMTLFMSAVVVLPTLWLLLLLRADVGQLADHLAAELAAGRLRAPAFVGNLPVIGPDIATWLQAVLAEPARLKAELKALFGRLDTEALALIGGVGKNLAKLAFALFTLFFVYLNGLSLVEQARTILKAWLAERAEGYIEAVASTTRAVVYGILLTALVQGAVAGLGYWVAGVAAPVTLTAVTVLVALVPFGTPLVWGSVAVWLLLTGQTVAGVGLLLWGGLVVSWVDNIVRPVMLSRAGNIPFILALFGVLGGLAAFGMVGLFLGPVILAVALAVWREWL